MAKTREPKTIDEAYELIKSALSAGMGVNVFSHWTFNKEKNSVWSYTSYTVRIELKHEEIVKVEADSPRAVAQLALSALLNWRIAMGQAAEHFAKPNSKQKRRAIAGPRHLALPAPVPQPSLFG